MTFLEIEAFLKITETGSFSAAAEALYVTQPALGRRIRAMEEELGYPLFVRGKGLRKVELTRQGHAFIGIAHRWQALWNETREAALLAPSRNFYVASVGRPAGVHASHRVPHLYEGESGMPAPTYRPFTPARLIPMWATGPWT